MKCQRLFAINRIFLWPIIFFILSIIFFVSGSDAVALGAIFLILTIPMAISALLTFKTSEFGVTSRRVIAKVGFIRRNSLEVLIDKIEGISVDRGIIGRIIGCG